MLMYFFYFIFLISGLCFGSFLSCVIYRIKEKKSVKGRSFCPQCKHKLEVIDLIPVLSYLFQKGRCRYCKKKISIEYPLIEIVTGLVFFSIGARFLIPYLFILNENGIFPNPYTLSFLPIVVTIFLLLISCFLVVIFFYDLKYLIIPDKVVYPAIGFAFAFWFLAFVLKKLGTDFSFFFSNYPTFSTLLAAFGAGGFFYLLAVVSEGKWMGGGDIKLAFLMGLLLGWSNILVALFFAFIAGSLVGTALLLVHQKKLKDEIPFGPFLITGLFFALFFGEIILNWYSGIL